MSEAIPPTSNPKALDRLLFEGVEYIPWSKAVDNTMNLNREIQRLMGALRGIATNRLTGSTNQTPAYSAGVRAGLAMAADMATRALEYHSLRGSPDETSEQCPGCVADWPRRTEAPWIHDSPQGERLCEDIKAIESASEKAPETGKKRAYYETHEPPHCPTCACHVCICTSARGIEPTCPVHSPQKASALQPVPTCKHPGCKLYVESGEEYCTDHL